MTDLELITAIRRADNPKALELLREAIERGRMEGSGEMAERLSEENARLRDCLGAGRDLDDGLHPAWCGWADRLLARDAPTGGKP